MCFDDLATRISFRFGGPAKGLTRLEWHTSCGMYVCVWVFVSSTIFYNTFEATPSLQDYVECKQIKAVEAGPPV